MNTPEKTTDRIPALAAHALPDARRASPEDLLDHVRKVSGSPVVSALLDTVDAILLVVNEQRQIVAFNDRLDRLPHPGDAVGLRLGEALSCINAREGGGCGTTPACAICGALSAVLKCQEIRRPVESECLMRSEAPAGASIEFNVRAAPLLVEETPFTVISLRDISCEKRLDALEQIFLHDVMNTIAGLRGWTVRLRRANLGDAAAIRAAERIDALSRQVELEIQDHRALMLAERSGLTPTKALLGADDLLGRVEAVFSCVSAGEGGRLEIEAAPEVAVFTDASLLLRVLVNMVRNALEAVPSGGTVRAWCEQVGPDADRGDGAVRFSVWNGGAIPPSVQASVFKRSFSTKAQRGRGLGTYGMKVIGERILGGRVTFSSSVEAGTVFSITLPSARD